MPEYDEERFESFKQELFALCKKHNIEIQAGQDGELCICHCEYKEDEQPYFYSLENFIRKQ